MIAVPVENDLSMLQRMIAEAIFSDAAPIPAAIRTASGPASASRFDVYRNNVMAGLMNAVAARYPVVRKLLWDDSFERIARFYVMSQPPRSPVMFEYGESFPQFLRTIGQGVAVDYLADIAELEAARSRAYHATDARPVGEAAFAGILPDQFARLRLTLHPSVVLLRSSSPVVSIWESHHAGRDDIVSEWKPEAALVARPHLQVKVTRMSAGAYEFLTALSRGQTVAAAILHAMANAHDFDLVEAITTLIAADVVVGFESSEPSPSN